MGEPNFIVVDNFYSRPDEVLDFATSLDFGTTLLSATESLVSKERSPTARETLARIAGLADVEPNWEQMDRIHKFWGFSGCGEFQLRTDGHATEGRKHYHANGEWTGLVYLSQVIPTGSFGTRFYRHIPSGASHLSDLDPATYLQIKNDSSDANLWERFEAPELKFNRLVLFDPRYFHAEPPGFGTDAKTGRLVQIFNFTSIGFKPSNHL